jgi:hypothetical protein
MSARAENLKYNILTALGQANAGIKFMQQPGVALVPSSKKLVGEIRQDIENLIEKCEKLETNDPPETLVPGRPT